MKRVTQDTGPARLTMPEWGLIAFTACYFFGVYPQYRTALIFVLVAGLGYASYYLRDPARRRAVGVRYLPIIALPVAALVLAPFGINPEYSGISGAKLLVEILAGIGFIHLISGRRAEVQTRLTLAAVIGTMIGSVLVGADALTAGTVFGWFKGARSELVVMNSNSAPLGISAVMLPVLFVRLWHMRRRALALVYTAVVAASIFILWQWAAKVAILVGLCALIAGYLRPAFWVVPLGLIFAGLMTALPLALALDVQGPGICSLWSKPSSVHRLIIWHEAAQKISRHPLIGIGIEGARFLPDSEDRIKLDQCAESIGPDDPFIQTGFQRLPIYPHNVFLEIWLSLGAIGAAVCAAILAALARTLYFAARPVRIAAGGVLSVVLVYFSLGYSLWQGWWLATLFTAAAFTLTAARVEAAMPDDKAARESGTKPA